MSKTTNEEPGWIRSLTITCDLLLMISTYSILILGLIIVGLKSSFGLKWAEIALVSFVISILAGILIIPVRLFIFSNKGTRKKMLSGVIGGIFSINILAFTSGITAVTGFIYTNLIVIK